MITDIHRIPPVTTPERSKPRPIIFQLIYRADRQRIWKVKHLLKSTSLFMDEDLPEDYRISRGILRPVASAARACGKIPVFVGDKLKVDGIFYGVNNMDTLPPHLKPEKGCVKENGEMICFFGRHTPFSNFFESEFKVGNVTFNRVEQYLQHKKAELMGDERIARKMMSTSDPVKQKSLGRQAKGNLQTWLSNAKTEVYKAILAKFQQNHDLLVFLKSSGTKTLCEASKDANWGVGYTLGNPNVMKPDVWQGKNWLGELLMKARSEL